MPVLVKQRSEAVLSYLRSRYMYVGGEQPLRRRDNPRILSSGSREKGYAVVFVPIVGTNIRRSHIVWFLVTGKWPTNHIDHKDRVRHNDDFDNLQELTQAENNARKQGRLYGQPSPTTLRELA